MTSPEVIEALRPLVAAFRDLEIFHFIGGSVASSAYGPPRTTLNVDVVARLTLQDLPGLAERLAGDYYASEQMMADAVRNQSSFNLLHLATMFKVDVFVLKRSAHDQEAAKRVRTLEAEGELDEMNLLFASPEDIILHKLLWYRMGDEVSERQWRDVQGVLQVMAEELDRGYLRKWADDLDVAGLLERALAETHPL